MGRQEADLHPAPPTAAETAAKKDKDKDKTAADDAGIRRPDVDDGAWHAVTSTLWGMLGTSIVTQLINEADTANTPCHFRHLSGEETLQELHEDLTFTSPTLDPESRLTVVQSRALRVSLIKLPSCSCSVVLTLSPSPRTAIPRRRVCLRAQTALPSHIPGVALAPSISLLGGLGLGDPAASSAQEGPARCARVPGGRYGHRIDVKRSQRRGGFGSVDVGDVWQRSADGEGEDHEGTEEGETDDGTCAGPGCVKSTMLIFSLPVPLGLTGCPPADICDAGRALRDGGLAFARPTRSAPSDGADAC